MGIPEAGVEPAWGGSYRGYRGRGRGARSFYRGAMRGGPPRASMKLDNRPKKLLLKGAPEEGRQAVRDWYEVRTFFQTSLRGDETMIYRPLDSWSRLTLQMEET